MSLLVLPSATPAACPLLLWFMLFAPVSLAVPDVVGLVLAAGALLVVPAVAPLFVPLVVPLGASFDVPLADGPVGVLAPLGVAGRFSSTSPVDVPVVVPVPAALPVDGTQFAALAVVPVAVDVVPDTPIEALAPPVVVLVTPVPAAAAVSLVDGVVPVPFAPLVVFSPVKRWSGFVAVLFAESARATPVVPAVVPELAPVVDVAPAPPIVVPEEYPLEPAPLAGIMPGGHGLPDAAVRSCAPAEAVMAIPRASVIPAVRHRTSWCRELPVLCIVLTLSDALP